MTTKGEEVFGQAQKVDNRSVVFVKNDRVGDGLAKLGCRRVREHGSRSAQGVHATLRIDRCHIQGEGDGHTHAIHDWNFQSRLNEGDASAEFVEDFKIEVNRVGRDANQVLSKESFDVRKIHIDQREAHGNAGARIKRHQLTTTLQTGAVAYWEFIERLGRIAREVERAACEADAAGDCLAGREYDGLANRRSTRVAAGEGQGQRKGLGKPRVHAEVKSALVKSNFADFDSCRGAKPNLNSIVDNLLGLRLSYSIVNLQVASRHGDFKGGSRINWHIGGGH